MKEVKRAIRDAYDSGAPTLRIIVGKGNHSKNKIPVLKNAISNELQRCVNSPSLACCNMAYFFLVFVLGVA